MHTINKHIYPKLLSAFLLGAVVCYMVCHNPELADEEESLVVESSTDWIGQSSGSDDHASLQPVPDPGPGTKGFDPWANERRLESTLGSGCEVHCDGSIKSKSDADNRVAVHAGVKTRNSNQTGPTLAFPTVLPRPKRGHSVTVGVDYLSAD